MNSLEDLKHRARRFAQERDWEQFHSPKNLAMALAGEAGELLEPFQWLTEEESRNLSPETKAAVAEEIADVLIYLVRLADQLDIDMLSAVTAKIARNEQRYPAEKVRGRSDKYTAYQQSHTDE